MIPPPQFENKPLSENAKDHIKYVLKLNVALASSWAVEMCRPIRDKISLK